MIVITHRMWMNSNTWATLSLKVDEVKMTSIGVSPNYKRFLLKRKSVFIKYCIRREGERFVKLYIT